MTEEKKPKKKQPAYKSVQLTGTAGAVTDAFDTLRELGEECREIVDNSGEAFANTERIQALEQTADTLENINDVEVPDCVQGLVIAYIEMVPARKGRGASRAVRCSNAVSILEAARDAAQNKLEDESDDTSEIAEELQSFIDDIESAISDAEGVEFPVVFG